MAGMIRFGTATWTASYGLFDWVVDALADRVGDPAVAARLREITENNLGYLDLSDLSDLGEPGVAAVLALVPDLPEVADRELPASPEREEVVQHVRDLAALVTD